MSHLKGLVYLGFIKCTNTKRSYFDEYEEMVSNESSSEEADQ